MSNDESLQPPVSGPEVKPVQPNPQEQGPGVEVDAGQFGHVGGGRVPEAAEEDSGVAKNVTVNINVKPTKRFGYWFNRLDGYINREKFVENVSILIGVSSAALGFVLLVASPLIVRDPTWRYVIHIAETWVWSAALIPCGLLMISTSISGRRGNNMWVPALITTIIFSIFGVLLTIAGSPIGTIVFFTLSLLSSMVFRIYMIENTNERGK